MESLKAKGGGAGLSLVFPLLCYDSVALTVKGGVFMAVLTYLPTKVRLQ